MKILKTFLLIMCVGIGCSMSGKESADRDAVVANLVVMTLSDYHYSPKAIDDTYSKQVFDLFLSQIDGGKRFFIASDIKEFKKYELIVDDLAMKGDLQFPKTVLDRMNERLAIAQKWSDDILSKSFTFADKGYVETDGKKREYAKNEAELKVFWTQFLQFQTLQRYMELLDEEYKDLPDNEKRIKVAQFHATIEIKARERVRKNMKRYFERMKKLITENRFDIYLNAVTTVFDAHTNYLSPQEKKDFDVSMTGMLEGIGAVLKETDGYVTIDSIVPGGPAWKQGELKAEDAILKVGQGDDEPVDISDFSVDEAVKLIRGKKGTTVKLTVKRLDGRIITIPIVRDVVQLEDTFAKSTVIIDAKTGKKYGYIVLPKFYRDFDNKFARNTTSDMRNEIESLKKQGVDGIIFDLRNNGGGALDDAINVAGLFIKTGPIVQVRNGDNRITELNDHDPNVVYNGPMVVLVNGFSASASEIVSAALQDYGRAVIIGTSSTFGKGTVQNVVEMDRFFKGREYDPYRPLGALTLTIQKFYRINGESTQHKGVVPDIILPDIFSYIPYGEKMLDYYLPWDTIRPAYYKKWSDIPFNYSYLASRSKKRVDSSTAFKLIDEQAKIVKKNRDATKETLNLNDALKERNETLSQIKRFESLETEMEHITFSNELVSDVPEIQKKHDDWQKSIRKDIYIDEAMNVLGDMMSSQNMIPGKR